VAATAVYAAVSSSAASDGWVNITVYRTTPINVST
jgi:hypothetical protein